MKNSSFYLLLNLRSSLINYDLDKTMRCLAMRKMRKKLACPGSTKYREVTKGSSSAISSREPNEREKIDQVVEGKRCNGKSSLPLLTMLHSRNQKSSLLSRIG